MPEVESHNQNNDLIITVTLNGDEIYRKYAVPDLDYMDKEKLGEEVLDMIGTIQMR